LGAALAKKQCPRCGRAFDADAAFCPTDGAALLPDRESSPDTDPYIGTVLPGDIEIRSIAGAGAMGKVYRAYQRGIDRDVAVKILHRELSGNLPLVQRFHREAKIASKLQHPHVVDVYLAGQLADGALYIVMEYLDGLSLAAALTAANQVFPLERTLPIALQICDAVGEGHARGIVHRDLKPENVMLVRRADTGDWVKVLDFGIAKLSLGEQSMETAAGLIFGTARYISPEGAQGATVGPPGDVYAIATIVYQMLAGRTPFDADQPVGLLIKHLHETPPPLKSWPAAANVPDAIARVVMDNLAKDASRRAASARALGNALAAAAKEAGVSFSDVGVVARMSALDASAPAMRAASSPALEPTLDDAVAMPAVVPVKIDATLPLPEVADVADPPKAGAVAPPPSPRPRDKRPSPLVIVLAFLLGVAVTVLVMQQAAHRKDLEHDAFVARTKSARNAGHFVEPPGDNVRDLVAEGRKKWPEDPWLDNVLSDAADELVTRAMAARFGGDVRGARDLVKTALELDPDDGSARLLLRQYEDELAAMSHDAGAASVHPGTRMVIDVPKQAKAGVHLELAARVLPDGDSKLAITGAQFFVTGAGLAKDGATYPASGTGPFHAPFTPPHEGTLRVRFEANVDGAAMHADHDVVIIGR
jgi:serine/threonine-protein kinase